LVAAPLALFSGNVLAGDVLAGNLKSSNKVPASKTSRFELAAWDNWGELLPVIAVLTFAGPFTLHCLLGLVGNSLGDTPKELTARGSLGVLYSMETKRDSWVERSPKDIR
jgi:hypothetical protein